MVGGPMSRALAPVSAHESIIGAPGAQEEMTPIQQPDSLESSATPAEIEVVAPEEQPPSPTSFDFEAATQAGYSDDEILEYLTQSRAFDVEGALQSGYSKAEVIEYLSTSGPGPGDGEVESEEPGLLSKVGGAGVDVAQGASKGLWSTMLGISKLMGRVPYEATLEDLGIEDPEGFFENLGFYGEQIGEFFLPGGVVTKGTKAVQGAKGLSKAPAAVRTGAELATRAGLEAATVAGVTAAQTGGDAEEVTGSAAWAGGIPVAGKVVGPLAGAIKTGLSRKLPALLVNSLLRPPRKELLFGKQPGKEVAAQGLKASSLDGLLQKVSKRKEAIGQAINRHLSSGGAASQKIDIVPLVNDPIDKAIQTALEEGHEALVKRLEKFRDGQLMRKFKLELMPKVLRLSPLDAQKYKRSVGDSFKWTEDPIEGTIAQVKQKIYGQINDAIEAVVPGTKVLNQQYGNLLSAQHSVDYRLDTLNRLDLLNLTTKGFAATAALLTAVTTGDIGGGALAGLASAGVLKGVTSTAAVTRFSTALAKLSPEEKTVFATQVVPLVRNAFFASHAAHPQSE